MRFARVIPLLLLLAACEGSGPAPLPTEHVTAYFPPGGLADTIQIDAVDRLALGAAELVAPDGTATPASSVDVSGRPTFREGQTVVSDPYRDVLSSGGSFASLAPQNALASAALRSETQILVTVSSASIPLPDAVAYRRDWRKYRIRLRFGSPPGEVQIREIAAPEPPHGG